MNRTQPSCYPAAEPHWTLPQPVSLTTNSPYEKKAFTSLFGSEVKPHGPDSFSCERSKSERIAVAAAPSLQTLCQSPKGVKMAQLRQVGVNGFQNSHAEIRFAAKPDGKTSSTVPFGSDLAALTPAMLTALRGLCRTSNLIVPIFARCRQSSLHLAARET